MASTMIPVIIRGYVDYTIKCSIGGFASYTSSTVDIKNMSNYSLVLPPSLSFKIKPQHLKHSFTYISHMIPNDYYYIELERKADL